MAIIAIDPGANGGLAVEGWDIGGTDVYKMPDTYPNIFDLLMELDTNLIKPRAVVEKVGMHRAGNNASASAKFARHVGHLEMALYIVGIPVEWVTPQKWMQSLGSLPKDKAQRKRKIKELMQARYPDIEVTLWNADALGILTWAMGRNNV